MVLATEPSSLVLKIEPVFKDSGEPGEPHLAASACPAEDRSVVVAGTGLVHQLA